VRDVDSPDGVASRVGLTTFIERVRPVVSTVTPLGWSVLFIGLAAWLVGTRLGWRELLVLAASCGLLLVLAVPFVVVRAPLAITVELEPRRVRAGSTSSGRVTFTNRSNRRIAGAHVVLPVGLGWARFEAPALAGGASDEDIFLVPTQRRGVITIGPATSVRDDPVGLLQRKGLGRESIELIVHPLSVPLPSFGTGLLRDLDGFVTADVSVSDLAFHSLREYSPGDDLRYVHWRSTAKLLASQSPQGAARLQVRQFLDTRRSAVSILVEGRAAVYGDAEEYEVALQVAASLALRASKDQLHALLLAGRHATDGVISHRLLDTLARADLDPANPDLVTQAASAAGKARETSLAMLVSGSNCRSIDIDRAAAKFPPDVRVVAIRILPGGRPQIRAAARTTVVNLPRLEDLHGLLGSGRVA
jgi:uncharacterized protein (DUF58 family)